MIQFNLLPDVKLDFVKAQRTKHAVISASVIAAGVSFVIFLLLFLAVNVVQKKVMSDQTKKITAYNDQLKETPNIDKILTIQNQLGVLNGLHAGKPAAFRSFSLIQQVTSPDVSLTKVSFDYVEHTVSFGGVAPQLNLVNTMVDTLKYTNYKIKDGEGGKTFSNVVLAEYSRNLRNTTFTITASYEPAIFDNTKNVTFEVPDGITTPSVTGQPTVTTQPTTPFIKPTNGTAN